MPACLHGAGCMSQAAALGCAAAGLASAACMCQLLHSRTLLLVLQPLHSLTRQLIYLWSSGECSPSLQMPGCCTGPRHGHGSTHLHAPRCCLHATALRLAISMALLMLPVQEKFPGQGTPLLPSDAFGRARVRSLAQHVACEIQPLQSTRLAMNIWQLSPGGCVYLWVAEGCVNLWVAP